MGFFTRKKKENEETVKQYKESTEGLIQKIGCSYQVFAEGTSVEEINKAYEAALQRGQTEGFVPVLVPADDTLAEWMGILEDEEYSKETLLAQEATNGAEILKKRYEEYMEDYEEDFAEDEDLSEFMGELAGGEELQWLSSFMKFDGTGSEETILFEIPVEKPWQVIAWLPMGGWNECPDAEEMQAVCRYWYESYGAIPAVISHDTMEFVLDRKVETEEAAWALAKEHYAFTPDRVDQCTATGTLGEVADCLRKSSVWYFWWD